MTTTDSTDRNGGWLQRLFGRPVEEPEATEEPSLFTELLSDRSIEPLSVADIPVDLRHELEDEAVRSTLCRLQSTLRALLVASTPGAEPRSVEECIQLFYQCRHALEQEIVLTPDAYTGAVRTYTAEMERDYTVHGRCQNGEAVRITVPCWRLRGRSVVRGEAEPLEPSPLPPQRLAVFDDPEGGELTLAGPLTDD